VTALRSASRVYFAAGLILAVAALAFGVAGNRAGMQSLPNAEGSRIEWVIDPTRRLTLPEVMARPAADWRAWDGKDYLQAAQGEALWLRVTLRNPARQPLRGVLADTEHFVDRVDAWLAEGATWRQERAGETIAAGERSWRALRPAFFVDVPAGGERVVYLREEDHYFPYSRWQWWPRLEDYLATQWRELLALGLCFGALAALVIYNAVLWRRLRFHDMGYYVGYAGALTLFYFAANGGLAPLLNGFVGAAWLVVIETGALALSGVFVIQFARHFLATARAMPRIDRALRGIRFALGGLLLGAVAMPWMPGVTWLLITIVAVGATHALLLAVAARAWRTGLAPARFFVAAFGVQFACGLPAAVARMGGDFTTATALELLVGALLEMSLLSFAMADRFARTQRQLVEETEQRRMMEAAYADELETEVRERTHELEQANADKDRMLAVIGHDLRSPLTGLMRAADEATGEFARDAARTGRALLLMIEDLVLWARLRAGTCAIGPHPARAVLVPAVALHHSLAERGGTELALNVAEGLRVETDLVLAQTLVRNLVANALKFARSRVVLRAEAAAGGVRFTIGNDGPALSAEVAARIAADEDGPMTATGGLGLRLCREICRVLGIRLEARAAPEGGTEFGFTLKAAVPATVSPS
jgi:two-component system, sensor histidine kinase LadS